MLLATMNKPDGAFLIAVGSSLLVLSVLEILLRKVPYFNVITRVMTWVARLFVIGVWILMIYSGMYWLGLPSPWR